MSVATGAVRGWSDVQHVVGPLADRPGTAALYGFGAGTGAAEPSGTGRRAALVVPARGRARFDAYFAAFPAADWRHHTAARRVRLVLRLDGDAAVTLHRSDADGRVEQVGSATAAAGTTALEAGIDGADAGGLLWFEVAAGGTPVEVRGVWQVDAPAVRDGGLVIGMPTMDRPEFVLRNLHAIAAAPEVAALVQRLVVVDHGDVPVTAHPGWPAAVDALGGRVDHVRQPNLGGAGGFTRAMVEADGVPGAGFVTLLDDDVALEPEALRRAHAFALRTSRPAVVGAQQLELESPTVLQAAAETVAPGSLWWGPADQASPGHDFAVAPLAETRWVHRRRDAAFNGWWMCEIPLEVLRRVGYALPLFIKWDDAEFGLRAGAAGHPTVSLPGTAVWHLSARTKDIPLEWQAYFLWRNWFVTALLHGGRAPLVVGRSLALDVKEALAGQHPAVRLRHAAIRAVLTGPGALTPSLRTALPAARTIATAEPRVERRPVEDTDGIRTVPVRSDPPTGARLAGWAAGALLAQLVGHRRAPVRLDRNAWWALGRRLPAYVPSADGRAVLLHPADRRALLAALRDTVRLHLALLLAWPRLRRRYGAAAPRLSSPAAWSAVFGHDAD